MLSSFQAENRGLHKHTQPELNKRCAYRKDKFVRTTIRLFNAIFFSIFFLFYGWYVSIEMFNRLPIDFTWFCSRFLQFLQCGYRHMDRQIDGQNNGQTDKIMGRQTYEWIDMQYMCIDMQKTMIFLWILWFLQTDGHTLL